MLVQAGSSQHTVDPPTTSSASTDTGSPGGIVVEVVEVVEVVVDVVVVGSDVVVVDVVVDVVVVGWVVVVVEVVVDVVVVGSLVVVVVVVVVEVVVGGISPKTYFNVIFGLYCVFSLLANWSWRL